MRIASAKPSFVLPLLCLMAVLGARTARAYDYSETMPSVRGLPYNGYPESPFVLRFTREELLSQPVWTRRVDGIVLSKEAPHPVRIGASALQAAFARSGLGEVPVVELDGNGKELPHTLSGDALVVLGTPEQFGLAAAWSQKAGLQVTDEALNGDGFIIKPLEEGQRRILLIVSPAARGVLYGAYELEERTTQRGVPLIDQSFVPAIRYRSWPIHHFTGEPPGIAGRMRYNMKLITGYYWPGTLLSKDFPELGGEQARPKVLRNQQRMREQIEEAARYGTMPALLWNPLSFCFSPLESQEGAQEASRQAMAKAHPGMLADPGEGRCNLCPSHPATRKYVESTVRELLETFPEYEILIPYFSDDGGEVNCGCAQCKNTPYMDRIVDYWNLVVQTAREVNPKIRFMAFLHAMNLYIPPRHPEYATDPNGGVKELARRMGKDMEVAVLIATSPPGGDVQTWLSPNSAMLGQGYPLFYMFHYYEAGGPGILAPISPVETHLSWAFPVYMEKFRTYIQGGMIGGMSPQAGMEVAYWHPDLDARKYMRNWCHAKYGPRAGESAWQALDGTHKITETFCLKPRCSESFDLYRWGPYLKPWAVDMAPFARIGLQDQVDENAVAGFMRAHAPQPEELQKVTPAEVNTWLERFAIPETVAVAERAETMTAQALEAKPDEPELQRLHEVAVATNHLVRLFREYHLALVQANAARNAPDGTPGRTELTQESRKHLRSATDHAAGYARVYLAFIKDLGSRNKPEYESHPELVVGGKLQFHRLWWDLRRTYLPTILCQVREAAYLQDQDFGGEGALTYFDEKLGLK